MKLAIEVMLLLCMLVGIGFIGKGLKALEDEQLMEKEREGEWIKSDLPK